MKNNSVKDLNAELEKLREFKKEVDYSVNRLWETIRFWHRNINDYPDDIKKIISSFTNINDWSISLNIRSTETETVKILDKIDYVFTACFAPQILEDLLSGIERATATFRARNEDLHKREMSLAEAVINFAKAKSDASKWIIEGLNKINNNTNDNE